MKTKAHITVLVDRSGSMNAMKDEADGALRTFLEDQAKLDAKVRLTLAHFDSRYEVVYGPVKIKDRPDYELIPAGATALYDAIARAVGDTVEATKEWQPDKVILVVVTDGYENSSHETTYEQLQTLTKERKDAGWEIVFLAGHPQSRSVGHTIGTYAVDYDASQVGQTRSAYAKSSGAVSSMITGEDKR